MQLKGLVRFFAIALTLICLYQLSFTWFVRQHESDMDQKATTWLKKFPTPEQQYPGNKEKQEAYADSLEDLRKARLQRLLDSTKDTKLAFGMTTYRSAKEKELLLGLDLQGGMSVTMEVSLDGLIKSLANFSKDASFNAALNQAVARKANSGADMITLFTEEYTKVSPNGKLAPLFAARSNGKIKIDATNTAVTNYLREQAQAAFDNTYRILRTRIDRFGVASPNINPDPAKGIISIELAGINDKERVRSYLQSTANLQFLVYTLESKDIQEGLMAADKTVQAYLNGNQPAAKPADTASAAPVAAAPATKDTGKTATLSALEKTSPAAGATVKADSLLAKQNENPILRLVQITQPYQGPNGQAVFPAALGYVQSKDTGTLNDYFRMESVSAKFPSNLRFLYGKAELDDPKFKDVLTLYAIKTLDNGQAELEGDH
ncbi:MAG: protein translocase subunit SecDF, partial [Sphingobacteriia bacterium]